MSRSHGLGRGLSALLPAAAPGQSGLIRIGLGAVRPNPRQPRRSFDPETLAELAQSLRQVGMLQPILVRPVEQGRYEIVAGERRFRAAQLAGMDEVPAIVRHTADDALLTEALIENIHRADLDPLEEASAYQQLLEDFGFTHEELAVRLGRSRPAISNSLRLLALPQSVQDLLTTGTLTAGHARALLALQDAGQQQRAAQRVVGEGLSVRATEELVRRLLAAGGPARPNKRSKNSRPRPRHAGANPTARPSGTSRTRWARGSRSSAQPAGAASSSTTPGPRTCSGSCSSWAPRRTTPPDGQAGRITTRRRGSLPSLAEVTPLAAAARSCIILRS